jgi:2,3-bisphosphoglycerate-dependent phosphoglycerate mutase
VVSETLFHIWLTMDGDLRATRFILVRHGESEGNRDRRFTTSHLSPLTELGRGQAQAAAQWIAGRFKPGLIVVSSYLRARQTGAIIAEHLGLPVEIEPDLRERHMGVLAGRPYGNLGEDPTFDRSRYWLWRPAGGESFDEVKARAARVLDRLAEHHRGRELVVVSHGGVMTALWAHAAGSWAQARVPHNCGIIITEHAEGRYQPPFIPESPTP